PLGGQLRQGPGDRRPTDAVALAQLVLGGEPPVRPVAALQDLLEQQRLELEVDRYGQLGIDGHGSPLAKTVPPGVGSAASPPLSPGRAGTPAGRGAALRGPTPP